MLALCLILLPSYYAQNYVGIIGSSLMYTHAYMCALHTHTQATHTHAHTHYTHASMYNMLYVTYNYCRKMAGGMDYYQSLHYCLTLEMQIVQ